MLKVNAQQFLNIDYDAIPLKTSGLYAAPEEKANIRQQLFETLQAYFKVEAADSFFALSVMNTMGEIMIAPLGVLDIDAVKAYGGNQQLDYDHVAENDQLEWPLVVRFISHTPDAGDQEQIVDSPLELKADFVQGFEKVWQAVSAYLDLNQEIMAKMVDQLIQDSYQVEADFNQELTKLNSDERKAKVGFDLPDGELDQFTKYMSDSHEIMNIVRSAANFVKSELVQDQPFVQMLNDARYRTTYYWILDNTYYEMYCYYMQKYGLGEAKLTKYLKHRSDQWLTQMRQSAMQDSQQVSEDPKANLNPNVASMFDHIFLPINETILSGIFDFDVDTFNK